VAAATGIVRPSNGLTLRNGKIVGFGLPGTMLGMNQEIEYARSFESARIGLCALHSMLSISGALMMIKKTWFEEVGGSSPSAITDDIEFTIRLNRRVYDRTRSEHAEIVFAPEAICYTETPEQWRQYASQRNRWQRGTLQALFRNWKMFFNPRYGMTGLVGMPFFVVFEALSAVVEPVAWVLMVLTLVIGIATGREVLVLLYLAYILSAFLTLSMVVLTETTRLRAASWQDLRRSLQAIFLDNLGFHQFHLIARIAGTVQYLLLGRRDLGAPMERIAPKPDPL
jgi:cellulose synthase/poly-beta-1,6-N-acetylglucosamine synthase-like glycosyltransferase